MSFLHIIIYSYKCLWQNKLIHFSYDEYSYNNNHLQLVNNSVPTFFLLQAVTERIILHPLTQTHSEDIWSQSENIGWWFSE